MKKLFGIEEIINGFIVTWTTPVGRTFTEFVEREPAAYVVLITALEVYSANKIRPANIGIPYIPKLYKRVEAPSGSYDCEGKRIDDDLPSGGQR